MSPADFFANAMRAADADGRLPLSRMASWDVFPFDQASLRVVPLRPPELPEPARIGEDGTACNVCESQRPGIWSDEHWRLSDLGAESGVPLVLMLVPREHYDLPDLPDERAAELGVLQAHIARAIESLPHVARAHVSRWGDGREHLHVFFLARPTGFAQLRGTCLAIWDDLLPPIPAGQRAADAAVVAHALAGSYGGQPAA